jgi:hypothetical protein
MTSSPAANKHKKYQQEQTGMPQLADLYASCTSSAQQQRLANSCFLHVWE